MLVAVLVARREPQPKPFGAPAGAFSAERARVILARLVGDGAPHPTGTDANEGVRDRLIAELVAVGLEPGVEISFVCSPTASCANVQNVIARIPGTTRGPAIVLNAHYDSVGAGPGAGDDLASVAALVEVARALRAGFPPIRDIVFLFDDGEEAGLLGAEAWVRRHDPKSVHGVVVLEARGSSGRALMFETSQGNGPIVDSYIGAMASPSASSLSFAIYQLLPNDTNFTVFRREGMRGMAVAFIGDPAQYHTPANRVENVPTGTIQHLGDTALGLAQGLAGEALDATSNSSYFDVLGSFVVRWPEAWNCWLAIAAALLVLARLIVGVRRKHASLRGTAISFVVALLAIVTAALLARGVVAIVGLRTLGTAWPASGAWIEATAWSLSIACVAYGSELISRRVTGTDAWNAFGLVWSIGAVALAFLLPGGAYCLFIPLLAGVVVSHFGGESGLRAAPLVTLSVGGLILFGVAIDLPLAMGIGILPAPAVLIAMLALACMSLLSASGVASRVGALALVLALGSFIGFLVAPVWTPSSPRAMTLVQLDSAGDPHARLIAGDVFTTTPPPPLTGSVPWKHEPIPELNVGFSGAPRSFWWSLLQASGEPAPEASLESWEPKADGRTRATIRVRTARGARIVRLRIDSALKPEIVRVASHKFAKPASTGIVSVIGADRNGVDIEFEFTPRSGATLTLQDETPDLPPAARAVAEKRSKAMMPIHRGDRLVVSRTIRLTPALQ